MTVSRESVRVIVLLLLVYISSSVASTPLIAWSNRDTFSSVSQDDVLYTSHLIGNIHEKLKELDFIVVFGTEQLSFDDIAKYGGLYGGEGKAPLGALQDAVSSAQSSVWGGAAYGGFLTDVISLTTHAIPHYITEFSPPLERTGSLQFLLVRLSSEGNPEAVFAQHDAKIAELMKSIESLDASYAAFYTANHDHDKPQPHLTRVSRSLTEDSNNTNGTVETVQVCNRTAAITEIKNGTNITEYCALLCIETTELPVNPVDKDDKNMTAIKALYWPSWKNLLYPEDSSNNCTLQCNLTTFEFIEGSGSCNSSSLQDEYFTPHNRTSQSIVANLTGTCECAGNKNENQTHETSISLEVEFIFFNGSNRLPRCQSLPRQFWTMQLMVTETLNGTTSGPHYLTRFRLDHELNITNATESSRGLFYPFTIPFSSSYACSTHENRLFLRHGNLNRFVISSIPFDDNCNSSTAQDAPEDGPLLQFVGLHVQAYGEVYGTTKNETFHPVFDSIYYCEGYFDISGWMGIFVVLITVIFLYLSSVCIFSMQTIDRFDDPRGQTITIENLH